MQKTTTIGRILFNEAIPEEHRAGMDGRHIGNGEVKEILTSVAKNSPDDYGRISKDLLRLGDIGATETNTSFSLGDLRPPIDMDAERAAISEKASAIRADKSLSKGKRDEALAKLYGGASSETAEKAYRAALARGSGLAKMVAAGARGSVSQLNSSIGADWMVSDSKGRPVLIPIERNYSSGLTPAEYLASSYGTRLGLVATKLAVQNSGFFAKQLAAAAGDLFVTKMEDEGDQGTIVDAGDRENIGSVLAEDYGPFRRGQVIDEKIFRTLSRLRKGKNIAVMSAISSNMPSGIAAMSAGVRERGTLPSIRDAVGLSSSSGLSEPISQGMLSTKHTAGVASSGGGSNVHGFKAINALAQMPKTYPYAATLSGVDGVVGRVEDAPQGGKFVNVSGKVHYVPPDRAVTVSPGDEVEAGDSLSEGVPSPAEILEYKGIGEARKYFTNAMMNTLKGSGTRAIRRNVEPIARSLFNHVEIVDPDASPGSLPGDVIEYSKFAATYSPRESAAEVRPSEAIGQFLEAPVYHHTIGTRITKSLAREIEGMGKKSVLASPDEPGFKPRPVRMMDNPAFKDDWVTHLGQSYVQRNFVDDINSGGATSKFHGDHWAPGLAKGVEFGISGDESKPY